MILSSFAPVVSGNPAHVGYNTSVSAVLSDEKTSKLLARNLLKVTH